ncbi:hypothetical protein EON62_04780, partial [archaeon]
MTCILSPDGVSCRTEFVDRLPSVAVADGQFVAALHRGASWYDASDYVDGVDGFSMLTARGDAHPVALPYSVGGGAMVAVQETGEVGAKLALAVAPAPKLSHRSLPRLLTGGSIDASVSARVSGSTPKERLGMSSTPSWHSGSERLLVPVASDASMSRLLSTVSFSMRVPGSELLRPTNSTRALNRVQSSSVMDKRLGGDASSLISPSMNRLELGLLSPASHAAVASMAAGAPMSVISSNTSRNRSASMLPTGLADSSRTHSYSSLSSPEAAAAGLDTTRHGSSRSVLSYNSSRGGAKPALDPWKRLDRHPVYVLQCHLNHPGNLFLVNTHLREQAEQRGRAYLRLLRLLSSEFFQPENYDLQAHIASGAYGSVVAAVASTASPAVAALKASKAHAAVRRAQASVAMASSASPAHEHVVRTSRGAFFF